MMSKALFMSLLGLCGGEALKEAHANVDAEATRTHTHPRRNGHQRQGFSPSSERISALHSWDPEQPVSPNTANRRIIDTIMTTREYHRDGRNPLWCSDAEWTARTEAAALHRLIFHHGMSQDLDALQCVIHRIPDSEEFLIGEWGLFFAEQTASQILKYDFEGNTVHADMTRGPARSDRSNMGCVLVGIQLFQMRPDIQTILHVNPPSVMAVGGLKVGLLPLSHSSFFLYGQISRENFDFYDEDSYAAALKRGFSAGKRAMFLNHHGLFAVGRDAAESFYVAKSISHACDIQVSNLAMAENSDQVILPPSESLVSTSKDMVASPDHSYDGSREWPGLVRQVGREHPDYNI